MLISPASVKTGVAVSNTSWTHLRILLWGRAPVAVGQLGKQGGQLLCEAPQARLVLLQTAAPHRQRMLVGCSATCMPPAMQPGLAAADRQGMLASSSRWVQLCSSRLPRCADPGPDRRRKQTGSKATAVPSNCGANGQMKAAPWFQGATSCSKHPCGSG